MRLFVALAVSLILASGAARAQPFAESIVALRLNGVAAAEPLLVRFDDTGALLLRDADLATLRLKTPPVGLLLVEGTRYYRFADGDGRHLLFDPATQSVELTLPATAFATTRESGARPGTRSALPRPMVSPGGFLNYEVSAESSSGDTRGGAFLEGGVFGTQGVLTSTAVLRSGTTSGSGARLDTTWTRDFPERLASLRLGDSINATGAWGRASRFAGVQFGTNFATQPTLVTTPLLAASGEALVPSTVDVFVNGLPAASVQVPPGPFAIENVPAINGAGQMQVVVTDALGRQQLISQPFYAGASLLQPGLDQYSFEFGVIRENYALRSFDYGDWLAAATWRRGFSDGFTAEAHAEGNGAGVAALGLDAALRLGRWGILSTSAATGGDERDRGWLAGLGIEHSGARVSAYARSQWYTRGFAQLGTDRSEPAPKQQSFVGLGLNLAGMGSLQFAWGLQDAWSGTRRTTLGAGWSRSLGGWGFLNLYASRSTAEDSNTELQMNWTMPFRERGSAHATVRQRSAERPGGQSRSDVEAVLGLQQNLPVGTGSGYDLSISTAEEYRLGYAYQGRAGLLSIDHVREGALDGTRIGALGGLAITGRGVMPSRVLDQSFAVVSVADYAGIPVYVDNQPVGLTDRRGRVLIDRLRAYESNEVRVDVLSLPMDAVLQSEEMKVTPAYRAGTVVAFPVRRTRATTFRLVLDDGHPVPVGAMLHLGEAQVPVARDGFVYLEDTALGRQAGHAEWPGSRCEFAFERGNDGDPLPDLGNLACRGAP